MRAILALLAAFCGTLARAEGEMPGKFDHYVLALSWSPAWCVQEGDARSDPQCRGGRGLTFILHGLWPQFSEGWPSWCETNMADPDRAATAGMADVMGSAGLALHQWKKHGRCSGLDAEAYLRLARKAYAGIAIPPLFQRAKAPLVLSAQRVEEAFLASNPNLAADGVTVTCKQGLIREVRICLTRDLAPRTCGQDAIRDCRRTDAVLEPVR